MSRATITSTASWRTTLRLLVGVTFGGLVSAAQPLNAKDLDGVDQHVRSSNTSIRTLIDLAMVPSNTFRGLVDAINDASGIVYVEDGPCGRGARACLARVTTTAGLRYFYLHGVRSTGGFLTPFETAAAVETGDAVRLEVQQYRRNPQRAQTTSDSEALVDVGIDDSGCVASPRVLEAAKAEASRTYFSIGVSLAWIDRSTNPTRWPVNAPDVTVVLLSRARTDTFLMHRRLSHTALGIAPLRTRHVYVFYERIRQRALTMGERAETILGRVIAHEIGHHLLPANGHSEAGIMRASLDYRTEEPLRFTEAEANSIRALLRAPR